MYMYIYISRHIPFSGERCNQDDICPLISFILIWIILKSTVKCQLLLCFIWRTL